MASWLYFNGLACMREQLLYSDNCQWLTDNASHVPVLPQV